MSVLTALPDGVVADLEGRITGLRECRVIEGRFDEKELERVSTRSPAVLVARLGARQSLPNPEFQLGTFGLSMAAFVITTDRLGSKSRATQGAIVDVLLRLIPENRWGQAAAGEATDVRESPIVSDMTRRKKVLMTVITWTQPIVLETLPDAQFLDLTIFTRQAGAGEDMTPLEPAEPERFEDDWNDAATWDDGETWREDA